jgi:hypothetical protein
MGDVATIVVVLAGFGGFAMLAAWFVRVGYGQFGAFAQGRDDASWWRSNLPWPRGVQEDDDIAWHVPRPTVVPAGRVPAALPAGKPVPPTRPQRRIQG